MKELVVALVAGMAVLGCAKHPPAPAPKAQTSELSWPTDHAVVFDLKLVSSSRMLSAPVPAKLTLVSKLDVTFRDSAGHQQALVTFREPHFVDAAGHDLAGAENLISGLKAPLVLELENGLIAAYIEPPGTGMGALGLRRYVATALQLAPHANSESWQSTEWDPTGLADVEYRAEPQKGQIWSWKKLKYEKVIAAQERAARADVTTNVAPKIASSSGELATDAQGIVAVDRHEALEMPLSASESLASVTDIHLRRTALADAASTADFESALNGSQRFAVGTPISVAGTTVADEARVEGRTFPDVLGKLEALELDKDQATAARKGPLFHALVGLFRQQPETIALAVKAIRGGTTVRDTLLDALAMASSVEAVDALGKLTFAEDLPEAQRVRAAGSLIRASRPGPDALRLALRMIDVPSLRDHGLLGVGSFTRQLREQGNVDAANQGTAALSKQLKTARSADDRQTVLLAIANSGSGELYEAVLPYQDDTSASIRDAAIQAVRLMARPEVEPRLRSLLERKSLDDLKSALHAFGRRDANDEASVARVEQLAQTHANADVRREAVLVLAHWLAKWPAIGPIMAEIRQKDGDQRVRDVATPKSAP